MQHFSVTVTMMAILAACGGDRATTPPPPIIASRPPPVTVPVVSAPPFGLAFGMKEGEAEQTLSCAWRPHPDSAAGFDCDHAMFAGRASSVTLWFEDWGLRRIDLEVPLGATAADARRPFASLIADLERAFGPAEYGLADSGIRSADQLIDRVEHDQRAGVAGWGFRFTHTPPQVFLEGTLIGAPTYHAGFQFIDRTR